MKFTITKLGLAAVATIMAGVPIAAEARSLTWASGWPPGGSVPAAIDDAVEYIRENSDLEPRHFSMSLLSFPETLAGLRDGVADIGYMLMPYWPAEFAESNLVADLAMLSTTGEPTNVPGLVMSSALAEYIVLHCPECQDEYLQQNQVYLGGGSTPEYTLLCTQPVRDPDDLRGLRIRTAGDNFGRWAENFGATRVAISGGEMYEALSARAVDCAIAAIPELVNLRLIDVVTHVTPEVPGGVFSGVGSANVNLDVWRDLTTEQREVMLRGAVRLMANINIGYVETATTAMEAARERGIEFVEASPSLISASEEFIEEDIQRIGRQFETTYGLENVDEKIQLISDLIQKWKGLTAPVAQDREAFEAVLWDEIYSNIDITAYGLQ